MRIVVLHERVRLRPARHRHMLCGARPAFAARDHEDCNGGEQCIRDRCEEQSAVRLKHDHAGLPSNADFLTRNAKLEWSLRALVRNADASNAFWPRRVASSETA